MDDWCYLIRVTAAGIRTAVPVSAGAVPQERLSALLQTDVTERLRIPFRPEQLSGDLTLCYLIDARSGDRGLPVNRIGTCFYLTGCPVCGDFLYGTEDPEHFPGCFALYSAGLIMRHPLTGETLRLTSLPPWAENMDSSVLLMDCH